MLHVWVAPVCVRVCICTYMHIMLLIGLTNVCVVWYVHPSSEAQGTHRCVYVVCVWGREDVCCGMPLTAQCGYHNSITHNKMEFLCLLADMLSWIVSGTVGHSSVQLQLCSSVGIGSDIFVTTPLDMNPCHPIALHSPILTFASCRPPAPHKQFWLARQSPSIHTLFGVNHPTLM